MNKQAVRNLFIAILIWLPLQYGIVGIVGYYHSEPWPAFVFPGFKSVHVYDERFEITRTEFEVYLSDSEEPVILLPQDFFGEIPLSQVPGFVRTHFNEPGAIAALNRETRQWLQERARTATGRDVAAITVLELKEYYTSGTEGAKRDSVSEIQRTKIEFRD